MGTPAWPVERSPGVYQKSNGGPSAGAPSSYGGGSVAKFDPQGMLLYSTFIVRHSHEAVAAFVMDPNGMPI